MTRRLWNIIIPISLMLPSISFRPDMGGILRGIGMIHGIGIPGVHPGHGAGAIPVGAGDPLGRGAGAIPAGAGVHPGHGVGDPRGVIPAGDRHGAVESLGVLLIMHPTDVAPVKVCATAIPV